MVPPLSLFSFHHQRRRGREKSKRARVSIRLIPLPLVGGGRKSTETKAQHKEGSLPPFYISLRWSLAYTHTHTIKSAAISDR